MDVKQGDAADDGGDDDSSKYFIQVNYETINIMRIFRKLICTLICYHALVTEKNDKK